MDIPSLLTSPVGALGWSIATTLLGELFGVWLSGAIPFGWGAVLLNVLFTAMCLALIHPVSLTWILTLPSTLT